MGKSKSSSGKSLVIVESPAKAKTINKYLGSGFEVRASVGHVRDLPSKGLNVDIENDFKPTYDILPGKEHAVSLLKAAAKKCDKVYLATDLDREGEAIAWHLSQIIGVPEARTYRVIFNAITRSAIEAAFSEPGKLNMDKVLAQQARRILDRIVGYQMSPLLWRKVARGLSAGRVQSVAVKMVVEKEREIRAFEPEEYWQIPAVFTTDLEGDYHQQWLDFVAGGQGQKSPTADEQNQWLKEHGAFSAQLYMVGPEKFHASTAEQAQEVLQAVLGAEFSVSEIQSKRSLSRASAPFITSTMQQSAANRLGFRTKRTMQVAQQLYEGIDLGSMGSLGLITYMRTDSTHLSAEAVGEARRYIQRHIGRNYLPAKPNVYVPKKAAQQAHEAIRPTDSDLVPSQIKEFLTEEQFRLYDLIWRRFIASQMLPAQWDVTNLTIVGETSVGRCTYRATGRVQVFDGFSRVWPSGSTNQQRLPAVREGQRLSAVDIEAEQHFTKPPARYTEASLVKALEKEGIGRPSTYAAIISTIQQRDYVRQAEKKFWATDLGQVVTDKLSEYFPRVMDIAFTRYMEDRLDEIEEHHLDWLSVLREFYGPFKENLETAMEKMKHAKAEVAPSEYDCPKCGAKLVYRFGRNGRFLSCSAYPDCKFACPCDENGAMVAQEVSEHRCPLCGKVMVYKRGRFGRFLGCSGYPECKSVLKLDKQGNVLPPKPAPEPTGVKCYKCKEGELVVRQSKRGPFLGCNRFPRCRTIVSYKQLSELKRLQAAGKWPPETAEQARAILDHGKKKAAKKGRAVKKS